jgi:hypothetical protein
LFCETALDLNQITEGKRLDGGEFRVTRALEEISFLGKLGCSLEVYLDTGLGGLGLGLFVLDLSCQDFLLALGVTNVLDSDMDALLDDASVDHLVDTNTDGGLGDVEDDSGASVVSLVGHTLVDGGIGKDVDVVTHLDVHQVLRQVDGSVLPEFLGKHVARTRSGSEGVGHLVVSVLVTKKEKRSMIWSGMKEFKEEIT